MSVWILQYQGPIRTVVYLGLFAIMAAWELLAPRRVLTSSRVVRWVSNLGVLAVSTLLLRAVFPVLAVGVAAVAQQQGWGLLNRPGLPPWLAFVAGVVLLDLVIYLQHAMFHGLPLLWRLHRMHHTDLDLDFTSGGRFHPIEILLSMGIKLVAVAVLGAPPAAVVVFEVLLFGTATFNHGNVRMPLALDRWLRLLVVTPDMHRVHHSIDPGETNSNFGFNLPWWDRLFGTYRAQPRAGHEGMTIGIEQFRDPAELWLHRLLIQPFRGSTEGYTLTRWSREG